MARLPPNFRDRPRAQRLALDLAVALGLRPVKDECCRKFDEGKPCCKGCNLLYGPCAPDPLRRAAGKAGSKIRKAKKK